MAEQTLRELADKLPEDELGVALRAKVSQLEDGFKELAAEHAKYKRQAKNAIIERNKAVGAKDALHKEKESLRKAAEEQLAGIKANVESLQQAKQDAERKARTGTHHTVAWFYEGGILYRTFTDRQKAHDFYEALIGTEKMLLPAKVTLSYGIDAEGMVAVYLKNLREDFEARMNALGIEPEVTIPDAVEDTLRESRKYLKVMQGSLPQPSPQLEGLIGHLDEMLIDVEPDWEAQAQEEAHLTEMAAIEAYADDEDNQAANEERYRQDMDEQDALADEEARGNIGVASPGGEDFDFDEEDDPFAELDD